MIIWTFDNTTLKLFEYKRLIKRLVLEPMTTFDRIMLRKIHKHNTYYLSTYLHMRFEQITPSCYGDYYKLHELTEVFTI